MPFCLRHTLCIICLILCKTINGFDSGSYLNSECDSVNDYIEENFFFVSILVINTKRGIEKTGWIKTS